jgi:gamma-glutamylcyclotransferase (GGCT)/AIG2-like uncharacterized protein YtfP
MDRLFVYGTLRSEFENEYARLLRSQGELLGVTTVAGSIYRVQHYPAWRPEPAGEVRGEVFRLNDPKATLAVLDEYEGADFERVPIETPLGRAWIYRYSHAPSGELIASGDFCTP